MKIDIIQGLLRSRDNQKIVWLRVSWKSGLYNYLGNITLIYL